MNERIKELLARPGLERLNDWVSIGPVQRAALEEFAELIVQECVQVGGPEDSYTDEWFKAKADSVAKIKEHFGVEL